MARSATLYRDPDRSATIVAAFPYLDSGCIKCFQSLVGTKKAGMHGVMSMIRDERNGRVVSDYARIHERNALGLQAALAFRYRNRQAPVDKIFDRFVDILEDYPGSL